MTLNPKPYNRQFFNENPKFFEGFKNNWNWQFFDPDFVTETKQTKANYFLILK